MNFILFSLFTIVTSISYGLANCAEAKKMIIEYTKLDSNGLLFEKNEKIFNLIENKSDSISELSHLKVKTLTQIGECRIDQDTAHFEIQTKVIGELSREEFLKKNYKEKINQMMVSGQFKLEKIKASVKLNNPNSRIQFEGLIKPYVGSSYLLKRLN